MTTVASSCPSSVSCAAELQIWWFTCTACERVFGGFFLGWETGVADAAAAVLLFPDTTVTFVVVRDTRRKTTCHELLVWFRRPVQGRTGKALEKKNHKHEPVLLLLPTCTP